MLKQPTITVIVYTYNSSNYVVETLNSIDNQTYPNLSLIITDDCSTDSTIDVCNKWIENHRNRFEEVNILTSETNTGISGNANRGWDACNTVYIKDIAGDDILFPNCVQDYVDYIHEHEDAVVIFGRVRPFHVKWGIKRWNKDAFHDYKFFELSKNEQYNYLIYKGNCLPAASCFYNIEKLREIGFTHDERIPLLEDYPKWITFARKGVCFDFVDKDTVGYRMNNNSLSIGIFSPSFYKSNILLYLYYYLDEIDNSHSKDMIYDLMSEKISVFYNRAYHSAFSLKESCEYKIGSFLLSPFRITKSLFNYLRYYMRLLLYGEIR